MQASSMGGLDVLVNSGNNQPIHHAICKCSFCICVSGYQELQGPINVVFFTVHIVHPSELTAIGQARDTTQTNDHHALPPK